MFLVLLRFSDNKAQASAFMAAHVEWIRRGFEDGVFLLAGSLPPQAGGALLAQGVSREQLQARVEDDPFVKEQVVRAEIIEIAPSRADPRLAFLV